MTKYGGYLEFTYSYDEKDDSGNVRTQLAFLRLDLGTVTEISDNLSKSSVADVSIVSMGQRYTYYVDSGSGRSLSIKMTRISPKPYNLQHEDRLPSMDSEGRFRWYGPSYKVKNPDGTESELTPPICWDQQKVETNMVFMGRCGANLSPDIPGNEKFWSTRFWSNAYWIKGAEKMIDRWQMKFDGADLVYWPEDDLKGYIAQPMKGRPNEVRYHGYVSSFDYSFEAGEIPKLTCDISFSIGRELRSASPGS